MERGASQPPNPHHPLGATAALSPLPSSLGRRSRRAPRQRSSPRPSPEQLCPAHRGGSVALGPGTAPSPVPAAKARAAAARALPAATCSAAARAPGPQLAPRLEAGDARGAGQARSRGLGSVGVRARGLYVGEVAEGWG